MAVGARFLIDSSVSGRLSTPSVASVALPLVQRGLLATCPVLDVELAYTATSPAGRVAMMDDRRLLFPRVPMPDGVWESVEEIQRALTHEGAHRGVGIADMLIAGTAAFHGLTVLHYDRDFDLISSVFAVQTEWVVPKGSL